MIRFHLRKLLPVLLCATMILTPAMPLFVFADEPPVPSGGDPAYTEDGLQAGGSGSVYLENHSNSREGAVSVSGLTIGGVDKPVPGSPLDQDAVVETAENESWEIPVLWVGDDLSLSTTAVEDRDYLPALAFFLPDGYAAADTGEAGTFEVRLADDLLQLFGGREIIAVYQASSGITYIIPASLRDFFADKKEADNKSNRGNYGESIETVKTKETDRDRSGDPAGPAGDIPPGDGPGGPGDDCSRAEIYCARTARDVLSDDELEYVLDLIINRLEPQAVNLLLDRFPAFREAADLGEIGREISLYVYYGKGDNDGLREHNNLPKDALVCVRGEVLPIDGELRFAYMAGVNLKTLVKNQYDGAAFVIRDGKAVSALENSLVRELFRAVLYDYNRTGMFGYGSDGQDLTPEQKDMAKVTGFPSWFIEGAASAMENVCQYRPNLFANLRKAVQQSPDSGNMEFANAAEGSRLAVFSNYLYGTDEVSGYPLINADKESSDGAADTTPSRYASGYLAVLYLSELAARQDTSIGSAVSVGKDGTPSFSSEKIRLGLNLILKLLHDGNPLDVIIRDIAPKDEAGSPLYSGTDDFASKFICGPLSDNGYSDNGDPESLTFATDFLNYMHDIGRGSGRIYPANGSVLFDFEEDFDTPLDRSKQDSSDMLAIAASNTFVSSTVSSDKVLIGAGKSSWDVQEINAVLPEEEAVNTGTDASPMCAETAASEQETAPACEETAASGPEDNSAGEKAIVSGSEANPAGEEAAASGPETVSATD